MFHTNRKSAAFVNPITGERTPQRHDPVLPRMTVMRVTAIAGEYLTCDGFDPDNLSWVTGLIVAKPLLLRMPSGVIRFPNYAETYVEVAVDERDTLHVGSSDDYQRRELVDPPYFVGDLITAERLEGYLGQSVPTPVLNPDGQWSTPYEKNFPDIVPIDQMEVGGVPVFWQDINVAGRQWNSPDLVRFEMVAALAVGGSAEVIMRLWDGTKYDEDPNESRFTVYDFQERFSKMVTASGDGGAYGYAQYRPDRDAWEIVAMQTPGDFWGTLTAPLDTTDPSRKVSFVAGDMFRGYDVFQGNYVIAEGASRILAFNPDAAQASYWWAGDAGDHCFCKWDVNNSKYWIMLMEPQAGKQTLSVVTSVTVDGGGHVTGQTSSTITLPKWLPIT